MLEANLQAFFRSCQTSSGQDVSDMAKRDAVYIGCIKHVTSHTGTLAAYCTSVGLYPANTGILEIQFRESPLRR